MLREPLTNAEKVEKLPWALTGDFFNVVYFYITFAGTILQLYLDELKLDKQRIGLILSALPFSLLLAPIALQIASRAGYKRMFLWAWSLRVVVMSGLIFAPWIHDRWGMEMTFLYVAGVIVLFALCRGMGESPYATWYQEYVPASIRGKYNAMQTVVSVVAGTSTVAIAGWLIGYISRSGNAIRGYQLLFGVAILFGIVSVLLYARIPGGDAEEDGARRTGGMAAIWSALKERDYRIFLIGGGLASLGWTLMASFLPLFYREHVHLSRSDVFYLDSIAMGASLISCFLWGWAADRFGSKPVMVINLSMMTIYPLGLLFMPIGDLAFWIAVGLVFVVGLVSPGWNIGYTRYFYVTVVRPHNRAGYVAGHSVWIGFLAGISPLIAGQVLEHTKGLSGHWHYLGINPWTPLFLCGVIGVIGAVIAMSRLPSTGSVPVTTFAGMFFQGNPIAALQALYFYDRGGRETDRVAAIDRIGSTRSPLLVDELLDALRDPSFNVRYEAVITIAKTAPHPRLTDALVKVLEGDEPDLATAAAWGLGRTEDKAGVPALIRALASPHHLIRTRAARALAMQRAREAAPAILKLFQDEQEQSLALAYAAALGGVAGEEALPPLLDFLRRLEGERARLEVALSIATILGQDDRAVKLWRRMYADPGDALAGVIVGLRRRLPQLVPNIPPGFKTLDNVIERAARAFGANDLTRGAAELRVLAAAVDAEQLTPGATVVLWEAIAAMDEYGPQRMEYVTLCVHAMHVGT